MTDTETLEAPPVQLEVHLDRSPDGEVEPTVPLRWCLTPELLQAINSQAQEKQLWVVIVNRTRGGAETRWVVPLKAEMKYISFTKPGENRLTVFVVAGDEKDVHSSFLDRTRRHGSYQHDLFHHVWDGRDEFRPERVLDPWDNEILIGVQTELTVSVPAELFAKPWPQWIRNYLNMWSKHKMEDQCGQRRRLLFTVWFLPFMFVASMLIRVCAAGWSLLYKGRCDDWGNFLKPFSSNVLQSYDEYIEFRPWRSPLVYLGIAASAVGLGWAITNITFSLGLLLWAGVGVASALLLIALGFAAKIGYDLYMARLYAAKQLSSEELEAMVCAPGMTVARVTVGSLSPDKRTIGLRASQLKTKVCRPLAG